jgi:eukaryotic-like serine/threonine-protein kinase
VARALECAHQFPGVGGGKLSILHRDLKPENLFLAKLHGQEALKILDFGIGKVRSAATQMVGRVSAEQGGIAAFTPAYGAPEQWLPKRYGQTGPWTDVWGFALCAVEALTNKTPFEGDAPAVMGACINEAERPTPLTFGVKLPERAEAAFRKALAVDPVDRFHDIGAFWDEIEAASGQPTPRLIVQGAAGDSLPPPSDPLPAPASSSLTELDATKQAVGAAPFPELTLGVAEPGAPKRAPRTPARAAASALEDDDDDGGLRISVVDNEPPPQRSTPRGGRLARSPYVRALPSEAPTMDTAIARMMPALRLIGLGILMMALDVAYAIVSGEAFSIGPVRALWIAGPLVGFGLVKLLLSLAR